MQPYIPLIVAFALGLVAASIPLVSVIILRERAFKKLEEAWERVVAKTDKQLADSEARNVTLIDRWYLSRNLPPSGVDLTSEHRERKAEIKARAEQSEDIQRENGGPLPNPIGPVDAGQLRMQIAARKRMTQEAQAQSAS